MNRLFGTSEGDQAKPQQAPPQQAPKIEEKAPTSDKPTMDLYGQSQKMDNRVNDMENKIKALDGEIKELYMQAKSTRGAQQKFVKQRLLNLLKKRKMYEQQMGHYYSSQNALNNIAFTNENIQNTIDMTTAIKVNPFSF